MKLPIGFACDYCGEEIKYIDKVSIKYEMYAKGYNYEKVKSYNSATVIALDLCTECAREAHALLETRRKTPKKFNAYKEIIRRHKIIS